MEIYYLLLLPLYIIFRFMFCQVVLYKIYEQESSALCNRTFTFENTFYIFIFSRSFRMLNYLNEADVSIDSENAK